MRAVACGILAAVFLLDTIAEAAPARPQPRPHGTRVAVEPRRIRVMDGDTAEIRWRSADLETVRVLGIDTVELTDRRSRAWSFRGAEARGFARGAFATADRVELLRSATLDRHRRTLGYFFLDGRNYSVLAVEAGLARETVSRFGDSGLPREAREVVDAARRARRPRPG